MLELSQITHIDSHPLVAPLLEKERVIEADIRLCREARNQPAVQDMDAAIESYMATGEASIQTVEAIHAGQRDRLMVLEGALQHVRGQLVEARCAARREIAERLDLKRHAAKSREEIFTLALELHGKLMAAQQIADEIVFAQVSIDSGCWHGSRLNARYALAHLLLELGESGCALPRDTKATLEEETGRRAVAPIIPPPQRPMMHAPHGEYFDENRILS